MPAPASSRASTAPGAAAQPPVVLSGLGGALLAGDQREEALALLCEAQQRHPGDFWLNYLLGHYWEQERPQQAVGYFRAAVVNEMSAAKAISRSLLELEKRIGE